MADPNISIHAPREGCDWLGESDKQANGEFQSTHPVRGATVTVTGGDTDSLFQSTHPVRGATENVDIATKCGRISIHAPREGCDGITTNSRNSMTFQSTHPVRGATCNSMYPSILRDISIHAPREGCDRENGLRIPRYGHSDHSLASIVLYNPLASPQIRKSAESRYQQIIHS